MKPYLRVRNTQTQFQRQREVNWQGGRMSDIMPLPAKLPFTSFIVMEVGVL